MSKNPHLHLENASITSFSGDLSVTLDYPNNEASKFKAVQIDLCDVRAADGIRVSYDYDRDGWKIEQQSVFSWDAEDKVCDPRWKEVAFVQAWGSEVKEPPPMGEFESSGHWLDDPVARKSVLYPIQCDMLETLAAEAGIPPSNELTTWQALGRAIDLHNLTKQGNEAQA